MSWQTATGATKSATVTVAMQVWLLPFTSVTVSVTVFGPTLLQSKLVLSRLRVAIPQSSLLPLSIWAGVMVTLPVASNCTEIFWQTAMGGVVSDTVTICWHEFVQPVSDTVTVRVKAPLGPELTVIEAPLVAPVIEPLPEMDQLKVELVRLLETVKAWPLEFGQTLFAPEMEQVGTGLTVMAALPEPGPSQVASETVVTV